MKLADLSNHVLSCMCGRFPNTPIRGAKSELLQRILPRQEQLRSLWEMERMADCDGDAYVTPAVKNEAAILLAMQATVQMPAFVVPLQHAVRQVSAAILTNLPEPPQPDSEHAVLRHLQHVDGQGELIWCLSARRDIRTFAGALTVLARKGFDVVLQLVFLGFAHMLYHEESIPCALALMLCHPDICPCACEEYFDHVQVWADALESIWPCVEDVFKNKRILRCTLIEKPQQRGVNALLPDRNPCNWNRSSKTDWQMLVRDLRSGCWLRACIALVAEFAGGSMSYDKCLQTLRSCKVDNADGTVSKLSYYKGRAQHYNSIHFLRCVSVTLKVRCKNDIAVWKVLCHMGGGVERYKYSYEQAHEALQYILERVPAEAEYYLDDLACLMCLAPHSMHCTAPSTGSQASALAFSGDVATIDLTD